MALPSPILHETEAAPLGGYFGPAKTASATPAVIALATGLGAGASLFVATMAAAKGASAVTPGAVAALQALGVLLGSFLAMRVVGPKGRPVAPIVALAVAATACFGLSSPAVPSGLAAALLVQIGLAIGLSVASMDAAVAERSGKHAASSVLGVGVFGLAGIMIAPLLVQAVRGFSETAYLVPAVAFAAGAACWIGMPRLRSSPPLKWPGHFHLPRPHPLVLTALLFGVVDNGVLSLAPAYFSSTGASDLVAMGIGFTAAAGATIFQLVAIVRAETGDASGRVSLLLTCLSFTALLLAMLCLPTSLVLKGLLLTLLGFTVDVAYGVGLFVYLSRLPATQAASATVGYVCACALGETVGPILVDTAQRALWPGLFFALPAVLAGVVLMVVRQEARRGPTVPK